MRPFVCALLVVACSRAPTAAPIARRDEPRDASSDAPAAWTDPGGVDALLAGAELPHDPKDPRSCLFAVPTQSCVPGPDAVDWSCRSDCSSDCGACAGNCRETLKACGAARACGEAAGKCTEECLAARDRCASACPARVEAYLKEVRENYGCKDKRPAVEICKRTHACLAACDTREACRTACKTSRAAGCNEGFLQNAEVGACDVYAPGI
jgi:hypothetical protein